MPLNDAGAGGLEYEGRVVLEVAAPLEDAEPGSFGPRMKWQFWVWADEGGTGEAGELLTPQDTWWQFTSPAMGTRAKARKYIEAAYAREIANGESGEDLAAGLYDEGTERGLRFSAKLELNENGYCQIDYAYPLGPPPRASGKAAGAVKAAPAAAATRKPPGGAPAAATAAAPARRAPGGARAAAAAVAPPEDEIDPDELPFE